MPLVGKLINTLLKQGSITVVMPDGSRGTYGGGAGKHLTIRLTDRLAALEIVKNPRLGLGETYMDGRLIIEDGSVLELLELVTGANRWEDGGKGRQLMGKTKLAKLKGMLQRNRPARARRNVAHHYDIGNEFYRLFLDQDLQYSCAYFTEPTNSLERAQADKKAHIAAKLNLQPGNRVLDIGCGWGGLALYLHKVAAVDVLGITLSEEQLNLARRRAEEAGVSEHVKFELVDYRLLQGEFDRIVSVGMFEHVGAAHYDEFFAKCRALLTHEGVMLLHTIGKLGSANKAHDPFVQKYIFPGGHLPSLSEMCSATQRARLIVADVEMLRLHYAYTVRQWLNRFAARRERVLQMYDERFYRMWEFYLAGAIIFFENGAGCNYQVQLIRDRRALPITRDYMTHIESGYQSAE